MRIFDFGEIAMRPFKGNHWFLVVAIAACLFPVGEASAADHALKGGHATPWVLICTVLVLSMQLGFALLETGLIESKNAVSVLYKNTMDFCVGIVVYVFIGYQIHYGFQVSPLSTDFGSSTHLGGDLDPYADLLYQAAFSATAATICSGALAGRIRLTAYLALSVLITGVIYPMAAWFLWVVGGSFFIDWAGSVVVHGVGGFCALGATLVLQPRHSITKEAHSIPLANAGMFVLLIGWFGFNMGGVRDPILTGDGEGAIVAARIAVQTVLGAACGGLTAFIYGLVSRLRQLSLTINGVLGGLVSITASCHEAAPNSLLIIMGTGIAAGLLVALWTDRFERSQILRDYVDDPVGAFPVHGLCGVLGGAVVVLHQPLGPEGYGLSLPFVLVQVGLSIGIPVLAGAIVFAALKVASGPNRSFLRVSRAVEERGLDLDEHLEQAYELDILPLQPGQVRDRLHVLLGEVDSYSWGDAVYKGNRSQNPDRSLSSRLSRFLHELEKQSALFDEQHGAVAPKATMFHQKIKQLAAELRAYAAQQDAVLKRRVFEDRLGVLKLTLSDYHQYVSLYADALHENTHLIGEMQTDLQEVKTAVSIIERWMKERRHG
ncbi:MAG: hypothetical protein KTR25_15995 [Myxococcales bacterium]|nr:hypothetical protein [Myxococcales bacterium]